ncbi:MAG TPA: 4a-hydroxytetrahydrobiopterin dehydratase [Chloroflexota bacterium]|jgi:4a-hydroxytetrahydrobiopterin dehydratase|nr:4a-hydroxytetrahydrobiopterin dehydratase [Chloroflexota bacterium]
MEKPLHEYACVPCKGGVPPLTPEEIAPLLARLDRDWLAEDNRKLVKTFKFKNFIQAVEFVNQITPVAESEGHHPDLYVAWGKVTIYLWTHKINGLTSSDFYMAAKIDQIFNAQKSGQATAAAKP